MIQIVCNQVKKYYGAELVLNSISFDAREGERIAIVGKNGCGKSTLLHLITGKDHLDEGSVAIRKDAKIGYLEQIPTYDENMTVQNVIESAFETQLQLRKNMTELEENMAKKEGMELERAISQYGQLTQQYESLRGYEIEERKSRICSGLKLTTPILQKKFSMLSGGEKTLIVLAKILLQNPDVLVLDEPTNHLDIVMLDWLEQYLKNYAGTVLIVSHDRYFLDQVASKVIEIEDGRSIEYSGNYSAYAEQKAANQANQNAAYLEQQKQLKQMEHAIKQMREWASHANNEKMFARAANIQKRMDRVEKVEKPKAEEKHLNLDFSAKERSGKDVLVLSKVSLSYGDKVLMKDLSFDIHFKEHVALIGRNGCGKTTLLKMILGEEIPDTGLVKLGESLKIGYLPQIVLFRNEELTILETIRDSMVISEGDARKLLAHYKFYQDTVFKKVKNLSSGEKSRLKLMLLMQQEINFLILDEPTNHLDIGSRESLEEALLSFQGTILFVSHDRYFINRIATRISELDEMQISNYYGDYGYYKEKKVEKEERNDKNYQTPKKSQNSESNQLEVKREISNGDSQINNKVKSTTSSSYVYKKTHLEKQIQQLEERIQGLEKKKDQEQTNYIKLVEIEERLKEANEELEQTMEEWMTYV